MTARIPLRFGVARKCETACMRATVDLDTDTAAAVDELRRRRGMGVSEAVNELIRQGLMAREAQPPFRQRTARLGAKIDVSNIAEVLETLDGPDVR